jgi:hypothetical protein
MKGNCGAKESGSASFEVACFQSGSKAQIFRNVSSRAELAHLDQQWWFSATAAKKRSPEWRFRERAALAFHRLG